MFLMRTDGAERLLPLDCSHDGRSGVPWFVPGYSNEKGCCQETRSSDISIMIKHKSVSEYGGDRLCVKLACMKSSR